MPKSDLFVLSDLHLADNHPVLEGFQSPQQAALEGLLAAALPGGSLGTVAAPHLIINGDCFDFLALAPYPLDGISTPAIGLEKLTRIAGAHEPFFRALGAWLDQGSKVTFLIGNHDIELCFAEVRTRLMQFIDPARAHGERLRVCLDQQYQPAPDVLLEHGNQYDFWNHTAALWDQQGRALTPHPEQIELPFGTQYTQLASLPLVLRYPFFDRFDPMLNITRQLAFLCLFDPALIVELAQGVASMISVPYRALKDLPPGHEQIPAELFAHTMTDFVAFQQDMLMRTPSWPALEAELYSPDEQARQQTETLTSFFTLQEALTQGQDAALQAIFASQSTRGDEDTTSGMHHLLLTRPDIRIALAGHTHIAHADSSITPGQHYLNTATWTRRLAPPAASELTPAILDWLRAPNLAAHPLIDKTSFVFAQVSTEPGQPSNARLRAWVGGKNGHYRELSPEKE